MILVIGNKNYSSWSLRPWLALRQAGVDFEERYIPLYQGDYKVRLLQLSPSGKVPALVDGPLKVWDSLAICEYIAEKFPRARLWPEELERRAVARAVSAEMHSGFSALRTHMNMNIRASFPTRGRRPDTMQDVARVQQIWRECRARYGYDGDFLFGRFSIADAMYAPVVLRFRTYKVDVDSVGRRYMDAVLALPAMQEWIVAAEAEQERIPMYE